MSEVLLAKSFTINNEEEYDKNKIQLSQIIYLLFNL